MAVFIDKSGTQLSGPVSSEESELPLGNVADIIQRTLGVDPVHPEFTAPLLKSNIFSKVKANLLMVIPSVDESIFPSFAKFIDWLCAYLLIYRSSLSARLANHELPNLQALRNDHLSFKLTDHSYPVSNAALFTSLASGRYPSQHGIIGKSWIDSTGKFTILVPFFWLWFHGNYAIILFLFFVV